MKQLLEVAAAMALAGCATAAPVAEPPVAAAMSAPVRPAEDARAPVTILVSIDGFRPDYLRRGVTPRLNALAAQGVSAAMRPSFPSITFPNHWTLVTGDVPDHHGIVSNRMEDPRHPGETFTMASDAPFWWSEAEPIWVTAEKAGIRTATMFWPGSNVGWGGTPSPDGHGQVDGATRPEDWQQFNQAVAPAQRVDAVIDWLRRPADTRPRFVTLYFDTVDASGHAHGPDAPETTAAVAAVDVQIGRLVDQLAALHQPANLVIVADHGMATVDRSRIVALDTIANPADYRLLDSGPFATLFAVPGHEATLEAALLRAHPHLQCWRKGAIPARFRYGTHPRIPPYLCLAETGWLVLGSKDADAPHGGTHGYDNRAPEMAALFIAQGPAFARGRTLAPFDNVDVAPLLRDLIGLPAGRGLDGDDRPFHDVMRR